MESGSSLSLSSYFSIPTHQKAARVDTRKESYNLGFLNYLFNATFRAVFLLIFAALLGLIVIFFTLCSCMEDEEEEEENLNMSLDSFLSTNGFVKIVMVVFKKVSKSFAKTVVKRLFKNPYY